MIEPFFLQPRMVAFSTSLGWVDRCLASITMMAVAYSCPILTTPFAWGWTGTFVEYSILLVPIQVLLLKNLTLSIILLLFFSILVNPPAMSFSITGGTPADGSKVGTTCATDWITIPCATNTNDPFTQTGTPAVCVDRICGMVFNSATTASGSPSVPVSSKL